MAGEGALTAESDAQEHPPNWQAAQAQNGGEGQKISLCEVPETQPQAREDGEVLAASEAPYPIWSPDDAFEGAVTLMRLLEQEKAA